MADETTFYVKDSTGDYQEASLPSFQDSLPQEIRDSEIIKGYGDAGALAQAFIDLQGKVGQVPESADAYEMPEIPEGVPVDDTAIAGFKALAHELGLSQAQVSKIIEFDIKRAQGYADADKKDAEASAAEIKKNREAAMAELEKKWGPNAKAAKMELINKVKQRFIDEDTLKLWDESGLSDDPVFLNFLSEIGAILSEDQLILPDGRQTQPRTTPDGRPILQYDNPSTPA